jgi:hypothetical protein
MNKLVWLIIAGFFACFLVSGSFSVEAEGNFLNMKIREQFSLTMFV